MYRLSPPWTTILFFFRLAQALAVTMGRLSECYMAGLDVASNTHFLFINCFNFSGSQLTIRLLLQNKKQ